MFKGKDREMKKVSIGILAAVMVLAIAAPVLAQVPYTTDLIADGRGSAQDVGDLIVESDGASLEVTYQIDEANTEWRLEETHLYVGDAAPSKSAPGRFAYKHEELGGVAADSYEILLTEVDLDNDGKVYIAAHAELRKDTGLIDELTGEPIYEYETAWAQGDEPIGKGKNWATCFEVEVPQAPQEPQEPEEPEESEEPQVEVPVAAP